MRGFCCYDNIAKCQRVLVLVLCLISYTLFTRYKRLSNRVVQPVRQQVVSCKRGFRQAGLDPCVTSSESQTPAQRRRMTFVGARRNAFSVFVLIRATLASAGISCRRVSVRPSFCLSQVGVLLKRLNVGSREQRHTIAHRL